MKLDIIKNKFTALYHAESDAIFRYCLIRTSNRETALDLTQEAFMRLWDTLAQGKKLANERAFIFTVARNLVIDWYRKKKTVSLESLQPEGEDRFWASAEDGYESTPAEIAAEAKELIEKMKQLEPIYRQAVYLRFVEDLKPKEIAEILGESVNVISVRINRGLKQLRQLAGY